MPIKSVAAFGLLILLFDSPQSFGNDRDQALRKQVVAAMKTASRFYVTKVASHGGYVYYYSMDLKRRWGEGVA